MDPQVWGEVSDLSTGAQSAHCPPGVSVYDADGEKLGTVSGWQDMRNFLIVHKGRLFGHDAYIPHAAIKYSDMNGVHLRVRQGDLTSMQQPQPERAAPISMALPILVPDMGVGAVAAIAFAGGATPNPALASNSSAQSAVRALQDAIPRAGTEASQSLGQSVGQGIEQATGLVGEQVGPIPVRAKSRRLWWRGHR
jgi:hypothetical protein